MDTGDESDNGLTERRRTAQELIDDWNSGERDSAMAELAEREERNRREQTGAILSRRAAPAAERPTRRPAADHRTSTWCDWIRGEIRGALKRQSRTLTGALGEVLADLRNELRAEHARDLAEIRRELEALRSEISTARRLDDVTQRLDALEAAPRSGLRAV